ncbi:hypothetical protein SDAV_00732 [Spiroplasma phoeniceum P40]|uniref:Uncharacterized protein n=1 Tax=Spiroplasma phoeniceum P40 TaxID=1276259 RepID=A0A345DND1_9MOLU|nr:hypothetical protein SDAV_00732 [Spiroplasma phoeniceum P40]
MLSSGRIYFSKNLTVNKNINGEDIVTKKYGYLYDELYKCINYEKTNIRDERPGWNKLAATNAFECTLSFFRFNLVDLKINKKSVYLI